MLRIRRLYTFMLQTFIPVFFMTFFICLFIVLMQFIWKYVDEMAGKGLEISVLAELFFYAAVSFVPQALPLSLLLASLMTFGNLGERLELLAMKAAGVSLIRIMQPLIILVIMISIGAFFFQNEILPRANVKFYTLLYSMRHKSPELDIPEGVFYKEIEGYNMYVKKKDRQTGMLYDVMIYDFSKGFEDAAVIVADSGKLKMTDDKQFLFLTLYHGESFDNLKDQRSSTQNIPYRRESFDKKEILIEFDANFNRMDDSFMANQYVGKNMKQLNESIDSLSIKRDSISVQHTLSMRRNSYFTGVKEAEKTDSIASEIIPIDYDFNNIFDNATIKQKHSIVSRAASKASAVRQEFEYKEALQKDENKQIRRHMIELHKKFTLSVACLVFFFIGAPLGAIIRKGGLGMPVIISVFLFIFYYIIDNLGFKMSRDGQWPIFEGTWLSTFILLCLGVFFTYKAVNDSVLFNIESYSAFVREVLGIQKKKTYNKKEVIIEPVIKEEFIAQINDINAKAEKYLSQLRNKQMINYLNFYTHHHQPDSPEELVIAYNLFIERGSNSDDRDILKLLSDYPTLYKKKFGTPLKNKIGGTLISLLLPFSIPYYFFALFKRYRNIKAVEEVINNNQKLLNLLQEKS